MLIRVGCFAQFRASGSAVRGGAEAIVCAVPPAASAEGRYGQMAVARIVGRSMFVEGARAQVHPAPELHGRLPRVREWNRSTAGCGWDAFPADVLARYTELHGCEDLVDGVRTCVETLSEPAKHRRFGRTASNQRTVIAVTSRYLVWASADETEGAVAAARLSEIETREYRSTLIEDTGLDVVGFRLGATERESWFLPIDEGADGRDFRSQLQRAIAVASGHH